MIGIDERFGPRHSFHYDPNPHPLPVFSYNEKDFYSPLHWGLINSNCDGQVQSPIHLQESSAVPVSSRLVINGLDKVPASIKVINNGHSAGMEFNFDDGDVTFSGGPLDVPYILKNVHWHWGQSDFGGSEHALNGLRYDAEAHFVSYNSKFGEKMNLITISE